MKYITNKKSILSKLALVTSIFTFSAHLYPVHCETSVEVIQYTADKFIAVEKHLSELVNPNNKTSLNIFITALVTMFNDFERKKTDALTRSHSNETTMAIDLMGYLLQHGNILLSILKKYNGKPSNQATVFGAEIKKEFNTEKIFGEMISKLQTLRCKAMNSDHKQLIKKIDYLIHIIQKKKNEWNDKKDYMLLTGLAYRMQCC
ncbi:MAG TPA: hypothetical protein VLB80_04180 [Candidatus Babeliales bacterium]|nr:hypothetical protein [Candidatus Babeliales bacterium]